MDRSPPCRRGGSPTAIDRIWGSLWGAEAVKRLVAGETGIYLGAVAGELVCIPLARIHDPHPAPPAVLADLVQVLSR